MTDPAPAPSFLDLDNPELARLTGQEKAVQVAGMIDRLLDFYGVVVLTNDQYLAWLVFTNREAERESLSDNIWLLRRKDLCQS